MGRSLDSSFSIVTKTGRVRFRLPAGSRVVFLRQNTSIGLSCPPSLLFSGDQRLFPGDESRLGRDRSPLSGAEFRNEWNYNCTPAEKSSYRAQGQIHLFSFVLGYKCGFVETSRRGIPCVLQSKFDIEPPFVYRNLWRYIESGDKSK
jgi:hypothetical protein